MIDFLRLRNSLLAAVCVFGLACASSTPSNTAQMDTTGTSTTAMTSEEGEEHASSEEAKGDEKKSELICEWEAPIGSNYRKRVCRPREVVERERKEANQAMDPSRRPRAAGSGGN